MKDTLLKCQGLLNGAITSLSPAKAKAAMDELMTKIRKLKRDVSREARDGRGRWTDGGWQTGAGWDSEQKQWVDEKGKPLLKKIQKRLDDLKLSKSLVGIKLNPDENGDCVAIGYFWNRGTGEVNTKAKYIMAQNSVVAGHKAKFDALKKFHKVKELLEKASYKDAMDGKPQAAAVFVIDRTGQRVGSIGNASKGKDTFGVTTMEARHVKVRGNVVEFNYLAKGGKQYKKSFPDSKLAAVVRAHLVDKSGYDKKPGDRLFLTTDDTVRTYMQANGGLDAKKEKFGAHMYRYWWGTAIAAGVVKQSAKPGTSRDATRIKARACKAVSDFLNNTPEVAYETYICPAVWKDWGDDVKPAPPKLSKAVEFNSTKACNIMEGLFDETIFPDFPEDEQDKRTLDELFPEDEPDDFDPAGYLAATTKAPYKAKKFARS